MKRPDCLKCNARIRCATNGQNTAYFIRATIKELRALLAIVTACPKRKAWDAPPKRRAR